MSWVTIIWSMTASACLTLALIYWLVWIKHRAASAHLFFSLTALSATGFAFCELWMMRAGTPAELSLAIRWGHVPLFFWLVSIVWFARAYLGAGRLWLAWTISIMRLIFLLAIAVRGDNPNFLEMSDLRHIRFLGESVTVAGGIPNPFTLFGHVSVLLLLIFVADASVTAWRRGDRRKALMVGGSIEFFVVAGFVSSALVIWADVQAPIVLTVLNLGLISVMGYELSHDVLRTMQLVRELQVSDAGLRDSEERMSLAVEVADLGIWTRGLERDEVWANEKWRAMFGFAPSEPLEVETILQRLHPDDREQLVEAQALAIAAGQGGTYQLEYRLRLPDGTTRWIAGRGRVECDAGGRPIRMRGAARDVTARKHSEAETLLLRDEIAHVGRVSMLGQLASALAHEINQPLAAILNNAQAAELFLQHTPPDLDEVRAILSDIRKDDQRAGMVIDRMRGLLKRHSLDARPIDVSELVGEVTTLVRADSVTRRVRLDVEVPGDLPSISGDRVHLQQVLLNLIINGMDALHETKADERRVIVGARADGENAIEIAVRDSGPGMSADTLMKVFDPFFTTKPHGMGMGLPISRTIVEAHGGRLWAENHDEGGALFRFTVPIANATAAK